jgi:hypothetical protein
MPFAIKAKATTEEKPKNYNITRIFLRCVYDAQLLAGRTNAFFWLI